MNSTLTEHLLFLITAHKAVSKNCWKQLWCPALPGQYQVGRVSWLKLVNHSLLAVGLDHYLFSWSVFRWVERRVEDDKMSKHHFGLQKTFYYVQAWGWGQYESTEVNWISATWWTENFKPKRHKMFCLPQIDGSWKWVSGLNENTLWTICQYLTYIQIGHIPPTVWF